MCHGNDGEAHTGRGEEVGASKGKSVICRKRSGTSASTVGEKNKSDSHLGDSSTNETLSIKQLCNTLRFFKIILKISLSLFTDCLLDYLKVDETINVL